MERRGGGGGGTASPASTGQMMAALWSELRSLAGADDRNRGREGRVAGGGGGGILGRLCSCPCLIVSPAQMNMGERIRVSMSNVSGLPELETLVVSDEVCMRSTTHKNIRVYRYVQLVSNARRSPALLSVSRPSSLSPSFSLSSSSLLSLFLLSPPHPPHPPLSHMHAHRGTAAAIV